MERRVFDEGMVAISGLFRRSYQPGAIAAIWPDVCNEPSQAMTKAFFRIEVEFHSDALVPIAKIRDMILYEGSRIREAEALQREVEAKRERLSQPTEVPKGHDEYSRACADFLKAVFSGRYTRDELAVKAAEGQQRFPGRGFDAWLNGSLSSGMRKAS